MTRPNGEQGSDKAQGQRGAPARRFYQTATIAHIAASAPLGEAQPEGYRVLLDGKVLRTPAKGHLVVPTRALAAAIAAEWQAQREQIDPASMTGGRKNLFGGYRQQSGEEQAIARLTQQKIEIITRETITPTEVGWLVERIGRDGRLTANERSLLMFLKAESPAIDPRLSDILQRAATVAA